MRRTLPIRAATAATVPADLRAAIDRNARASETFGTLNRQNLFSLVFRTNAMKTPAGPREEDRDAGRDAGARRDDSSQRP